MKKQFNCRRQLDNQMWAGECAGLVAGVTQGQELDRASLGLRVQSACC